jgi:CRISPR type IV-associated protein Csf1
MTTPELLASAMGEPFNAGPHNCLMCGASCTDRHARSEVVKDTFTGWAGVPYPQSLVVCHGCWLATREMDRSNRPRLFTWIITNHRADKYTKAHLSIIAHACINPPVPPFGICIATSGKKHLLYRTPVNLSRDSITVMLEEEPVSFAPCDLAERIELCSRIAAAAGKPALANGATMRLAIALPQYWKNWEPILEKWLKIGQQPLSRLAAFLCPNMEGSSNEYPSDIATPALSILDSTAAPKAQRRRVPAAIGGIDGPGLFGG